MGLEQGKKSREQWPRVRSKQNLQINLLKDKDLFTIRDFLTPLETRSFISAAESIGFVHQSSLGPTKGEAYRDNHRISVNDPILADSIWNCGLHQFFANLNINGRYAVGLNPNIRFYRYEIGQSFGPHIDESVDLGSGKKTCYTLLVYLSGAPNPNAKHSSISQEESSSSGLLLGGETVFYSGRNKVVAKVSPVEGMALLHIHGNKCLLHEALNVTKGVKYVLRSDVVFS